MHVTSSPTFPQSNGKVEGAVNSAKTVMRKSRKARTDPYLDLLEYRNAPSQGLGTSPVQTLMSRRRRAQPPIIPQLLTSVVQPGTYQQLLANKGTMGPCLLTKAGAGIWELLEMEIQCDCCRLEIRVKKL